MKFKVLFKWKQKGREKKIKKGQSIRVPYKIYFKFKALKLNSTWRLYFKSLQW